MKKFIQISLFLLLTGCQTGTGQLGTNYVSMAPSAPQVEIAKLKKWQGPNYYYSNALTQDLDNISARAFVILGSSHFRDTAFAFGHASNQAIKIGATHVIISESGKELDILGSIEHLSGYPAATLMGFAAAPPLSGINIDNIMTSGNNNNNNSYNYQDYYYDSPNYPEIMRDFECYFFARPAGYKNYFGLSLSNTQNQDGVMIDAIAERSVSDILNLRQGDVITAVNDQDITNVSQVMEILANVHELTEPTSLFVKRYEGEFIAVVPPVLAE